ncbi:uncharacterized protein [Drosophila tropicalis]|uniref:uncharacterized protein n=1 Tax=Drosophila tropicalis TaxID=46794 RepID=UPI0035AC1D8E
MSESSITLLWLFLLSLGISQLVANQEANRPIQCGPLECDWRQNPLCRCESFCVDFSTRCWKLPTGCHCQRGYARNAQGFCVPLAMCR